LETICNPVWTFEVLTVSNPAFATKNQARTTQGRKKHVITEQVGLHRPHLRARHRPPCLFHTNPIRWIHRSEVPAMSRRTLFIIDESQAFRDTAAQWLDPAGYRIVGLAGPQQALEVLGEWQEARMRPGAPHDLACLMIEVQMSAVSGLRLYESLTARGLRLPVVYVSHDGDVPTVVEAMKKHHAIDFLEKPTLPDLLRDAVNEAFSQAHDIMQSSWAQREFEQRIASLSPREADVMEGLKDGKSNKIMARELSLSPKTVELYRSKLMKKMQAQNVTHLIRMMSTGLAL
jgi:two-component system, LuxR family, response regulator FixJ